MRIITGYFFLALSVVVFLAIVSFNPSDSVFLASKISSPLENIAGILGVWIGTPLVMLYGKYASLLLDFGVFTIGINILVGNKIGRVLIKSLLFVIAAVSLSVILSVVIKDATYLDGGVAGITLAKSLGEILHPYLIIALFGISLLLSLSTTMKLFQKIIYGIGRIFGALFLAPFELLGVVMRSGRDNDEPERNFTARNSDEFEQEMARTGAEEGKTYFQHEKIPDFLRNGDDGFSDSNDKTSEEFAVMNCHRQVEARPRSGSSMREKRRKSSPISSRFSIRNWDTLRLFSH